LAQGESNPLGGDGTDFEFQEVPGNGGTFNLPLGYTSGGSFTDSSTYPSATFASLGIAPGTYTWTWNIGANTAPNSLVLNVNVPEPASLLLFGAGMAGLVARRRRPAR
jgi:hypothetical protein